MDNKITADALVAELFLDSKEKKRLVVLSPSTPAMRQACSEVNSKLRADARFAIDFNKKFKVTNSEIQVGNTVIFFGLLRDKEYLSSNYREEEIKIYEEN
jgi:hypothetical protein